MNLVALAFLMGVVTLLSTTATASSVLPNTTAIDPTANASALGDRRLDLLDESRYYVVSACGVDLEGGDWFDAKPSPAIACVLWCQSTPGCRMMSWTNYNGGTCWFKTPGAARAQPKTGVYSFMYEDSQVNSKGYSYWGRSGCDMPGNDLLNMHATWNNVPMCAARCNLEPKCWAFSWSDYNGGTCWLKTQATTCVANSAVNSYYMLKRGAVSGRCPFAL